MQEIPHADPTPAATPGIRTSRAFSLLVLVFGLLFLAGLGMLAIDQQRVVDTAQRLQKETMPKMIRYQRLARNIEQIRQEGERIMALPSAQARSQALFMLNLIVSHPSVREHPQAAELTRHCERFLAEAVKRAADRETLYPADRETWRNLSNRLGALVDDLFIESANFASDEVSEVSETMHLARTKLILVLSLVALMLALLAWMLRRMLIHPLQNLGRGLAAVSDTHTALHFHPSPLREINALQSAIGELQQLLLQKEEARIASEKLAHEAAEAAKRVKSIFLSNISHELRTPMNGIMGMTHLALRRISDPKAQEQLVTAMGAANQLLLLINDLIDISHLEAKRLSLQAGAFNIGDLISEVATPLAATAAKKGLQLAHHLPPDLAALSVEGDRNRLAQILKHLGSNAIKFTEQGQVSLLAEIVCDTPQDVQLRFSVSDTGCGIPEALRQRLFTLFEQGDGSLTRQQGGTGLGLALCKQLVDMMDGEIGVDSNDGQGSTFWFSVCLHKSPSA